MGDLQANVIALRPCVLVCVVLNCEVYALLGGRCGHILCSVCVIKKRVVACVYPASCARCEFCAHMGECVAACCCWAGWYCCTTMQFVRHFKAIWYYNADRTSLGACARGFACESASCRLSLSVRPRLGMSKQLELASNHNYSIAVRVFLYDAR